MEAVGRKRGEGLKSLYKVVEIQSRCPTELGAAQYSVMQTEGLVWEVLLRLPTKSLMRFKCVSKLWYFIIRDPNFAIARVTMGRCFRGLLTSFHCEQTFGLGRAFLYLDLNDCPRLMCPHLLIEDKNCAKTFTKAVKGLMGFYDRNINDFTLCNIATHELLKLPPSPCPDSNKDVYFYEYYIGFDPVKEVYKVMNLCICYDRKGDDQNYIFTLGVNYSDFKWRNIAPAFVDFYHASQRQQWLCISGTLYWLVQYYVYKQRLTAFHLNNETFETIEIPDCRYGEAHLVEICGSPVLVVIDRSIKYIKALDVWTMNNHCGGGEVEAWTKKRVCVPTSLNIHVTLGYVGTLPTGEILLADSHLHDLPFPIYIFDHLKNEFSSLRVEGHGSQESGMDDRKINLLRYIESICYYEENIISLDSLMMSNQEQIELHK